MASKKLYYFALGIFAILLLTGAIYGLTSVDVTNHFETGIVDIDLEEFQIIDGREMAWEDNPTIWPGDVISKIPRVFNSGNDCYIRAKITFRGTEYLDESDLQGIGEKWIKADDGYYYYTDILPHGENVDIFQAVSIPEELPEEAEGKTFYINIDVDAIQSKNFTPDFEVAAPWGAVEILKNEKGNYDVSTFKQSDSQSFEIVYQADAKKLTKNADDFFVNFPYLMPGDTYSDSVKLENTGSEPILLHFRSNAEDDSELLDKIRLKITSVIDGKTEVFYEGSLRAAGLAKDSILGTIPADSAGEFNFEIYVPHELNNPYSISSSRVQWIFSTEVIENPKTGDRFNPLPAVILVAMSTMALGTLMTVPVMEKRKEGRQDD